MAECKITVITPKDPSLHLTAMRAEVTAAHERGERLELDFLAELVKQAHEKGAPGDALLENVKVTRVDGLLVGIGLEISWNAEASKNTLVLPPAYRY